MSNSTVQFGFLDYPHEINFGFGSIVPITDFAEVKSNLKAYCRDGFLYPPTSNKVILDPVTNEIKEHINNSERPAFIYQLPASHKIVHESLNKDENVIKHDFSFLILILSFLFGTRLQFDNCGVDRKIKINFYSENTNLYSVNNYSVNIETINEFVKTSYAIWKNWEVEQRESFLGVLTMHSRLDSYDWDWEQFLIEYMVFDGIYSFCRKVNLCKKAVNHKDRFDILFSQFHLMQNDKEIAKIYDLRNNLFHESVWNQTSVGYPKPNSNTINHTLNLKRINERLLTAILGYNNNFAKSSWWTIGNTLFDKVSNQIKNKSS